MKRRVAWLSAGWLIFSGSRLLAEPLVGIAFEKFEVVSSVRVSRTEYLYTMRLVARNDGIEDVLDVHANLTSLSPNTQIVSNTIEFAGIKAGQSAISNGFVELRHDRLAPFDFRKNVGISFDGSQEPIPTSTDPETQQILDTLTNGAAQYRSGEILVKFNIDPTTSGKLGSQKLSSTFEKISTSPTGEVLGLAKLTVQESMISTIIRLESDSSVEYAEPDWIVEKSVVPNDPQYLSSALWGMYSIDSNPLSMFGSQAANAWARGQYDCSNIYVGVIDSGIMTNHQDLSSNIWVNSGEIPGNNIDDDSNGYRDDINGWDFVRNDNTVFDADEDSHGTHVAGTIGAVGGNGVGVVGVCWQIELISAKFLGPGGTGATSNAIRAIDYITRLKTRNGLNVVATNNSWGGGGYSRSLQDAIDRANAAGILFVAAAGNNGVNTDQSLNYPSSLPNVNIISVGAIGSDGNRASFSNYGATTVDLSAPGRSIISTIPNGYAYMSGTSMATPHVTGAIALIASRYPNWTAASRKDAVLSTTQSITSLNGASGTGGTLDIDGATRFFVEAPTSPVPVVSFGSKGPLPAGYYLYWEAVPYAKSYKIDSAVGSTSVNLKLGQSPCEGLTFVPRKVVSGNQQFFEEPLGSLATGHWNCFTVTALGTEGASPPSSPTYIYP